MGWVVAGTCLVHLSAASLHLCPLQPTAPQAVADLPRLEAAILGARRVGAHELDPEAYK